MPKAKTALKEIDPFEYMELSKAELIIPERMYHGIEIDRIPPKGAAKVLDKLKKDGFVIYHFDSSPDSAILKTWLDDQFGCVGVSFCYPVIGEMWIVGDGDDKKFSIDLR